jgi:RNase H-fold protein (predicted Holliday junction resolvase)
MANILALDVSTSTVGIALFSEDGKLLEVNHVSPEGKTSRDTRIEKVDKKGFPNVDLYNLEAQSIFDFLKENYEKDTINLIVIEQPMCARENPVSTSQLNIFAGLLFSKLRTHYQCEVKYIDVDTVRRYAFPELIGKNSSVDKKGKTVISKIDTLWGVIPKKILGKKIADYRKLIILNLVYQRYPNIVWMLNNNLNIKKENLDRADAVAVGLGYMAFIGKWTMEQSDVQQSIDFVEKCLTYDIFVGECVKKKIDKQQKDALKWEYLKNIFEIEKYLNVAI